MDTVPGTASEEPRGPDDDSRLSKVERIWALVAFGLVAVGSLGPWVTLGVFSKAGTDGDGVVTLVAAAVGSVLVLVGRGRIALALVGAIICVTAVYDIVDVSRSGVEIFDTEVSPSVGWGLWLVTLGGLAILACAAARHLGIVEPASVVVARDEKPSMRTTPTVTMSMPSRRIGIIAACVAAVALLVVAAVSTGVLESDTSDSEATGSAADNAEDALAEEDAPTLDELAEDSQGEPAPTQKRVSIGKAAVDDEVTFKVHSIEAVSSFPIEYGTPVRPRAGAKLIAVSVSYKNNTQDGIDIFCGGNSITLLDQDERNFDPMDNYTEISGNTICGDDVQPGFKTTNTILFMIPRDAMTAGVVLWNSEAEDDSSGDVTNIFVINSQNVDRAPRPSAGGNRATIPKAFRRCDANISAAPSTTCEFASNVFYEYFVADQASEISAYSPASGSTFDVSCSSDGTDVACRAEDGGAVRFPQAAIDAYSDSQAEAYAESHDTG